MNVRPTVSTVKLADSSAPRNSVVYSGAELEADGPTFAAGSWRGCLYGELPTFKRLAEREEQVRAREAAALKQPAG